MSNIALRYLGDNPRLYTIVGEKRGDKIVLEKCSIGCGLYGPYVNLPRGRYYASVRFAEDDQLEGRGWMDVCRNMDAQIIVSSLFDLGKLTKGTKEIGIAFELHRAVSQCQVRLQCAAGVSAKIESMQIEFRDVDAAAIEATVRDGLGDATVTPPFVQLGRIKKLEEFIRHPFSYTRKRVEAAVVERLAFLTAGRITEILADDVTFRFTKQSGMPSNPYQIWLPDPTVIGFQDGDYMQSANCLARDFYHRDFAAFCQSIGLKAHLHRKLWEFGFVWHHLCTEGAIEPGARGAGFGVGREPLPSLLAKHGCEILATDAPPENASGEWIETGQYGGSIDQLFCPHIVSEEAFHKNVRFEFCDMNAIRDDIRDYDFCWSSCSFEHLGSIENGLDFVVNSVEKVLKIGGVACHTSELNVSSNDETIERGATVLFRRRDVEALIDRLESRGHQVKPLPIEAGKSFIDLLVDLPPYSSDLSLRLNLGTFVTTSFGIVVTRGC
jgi:hypothetical protein